MKDLYCNPFYNSVEQCIDRPTAPHGVELPEWEEREEEEEGDNWYLVEEGLVSWQSPERGLERMRRLPNKWLDHQESLGKKSWVFALKFMYRSVWCQLELQIFSHVCD